MNNEQRYLLQEQYDSMRILTKEDLDEVLQDAGENNEDTDEWVLYKLGDEISFSVTKEIQVSYD